MLLSSPKVWTCHWGSKEPDFSMKRPGTGRQLSSSISEMSGIISIEISPVMEKAYWPYILRAQLFNPAPWSHSSTHIYINDSLCFQGYCSNHLEFQWTPFNYSGWAIALQFRYHLIHHMDY